MNTMVSAKSERLLSERCGFAANLTTDEESRRTVRRMEATSTKHHPAERARRIALASFVSAFVAGAGWFGLTSASAPAASSTTTNVTTQEQPASQSPFIQGAQPGVASNGNADTRSAGS